MKQYIKQLGAKAVAVGEPTPDQLAKINSYAMSELTGEQVYVRKFLMAHTNIDRDNECFPGDLIDQFSATMPGKALLIGHSRRELPCGKFFDATTEEMTVDQFKALTGEDPRLPDGVTGCKVLWTWAYLMKTPGNDELISQIDGGVCSFCSIGFRASDLVAVRDSINAPAKYWQYVSPGEALEGSLVWLGAQPGAAAYKAAHHNEGETDMKEFIAKMAATLGIDLSEEKCLDQIKAAFDAISAKVKELEPLAEIGKRYREELTARYVAAKSKLEEVGAAEADQNGLKAVVATFPLSFIENEVKALEKRVAEKFPASFQIQPGAVPDRTGKSSDNPLIPKEG